MPFVAPRSGWCVTGQQNNTLHARISSFPTCKTPTEG